MENTGVLESSEDRQSLRGLQSGHQNTDPFSLVHLAGQPKAGPLLTLFSPSSEELQSNKATLVCLISDFYPGVVTVDWKRDGAMDTQGVQTTQPSKQTNNKYMSSSYLTVTADEWISGCHDHGLEEGWPKGHQGVETTQSSKQTNNKHVASSCLTLMPDKWKSHETYTCQVTHGGRTVEKSVSPAQCSWLNSGAKTPGKLLSSKPYQPSPMPLTQKPLKKHPPFQPKNKVLLILVYTLPILTLTILSGLHN
ncbi:uncharacterized protein LOC144368207 [Ictidomys tridecemlineatus]